jgi:hypothetical protein
MKFTGYRQRTAVRFQGSTLSKEENSGPEVTRASQTTIWGCAQRISKAEILQAIDKLKIHKAEGFDGISAEVIKDKSDILVDILTKVVGASWRSGIFPMAWCKGSIQLLHKKPS